MKTVPALVFSMLLACAGTAVPATAHLRDLHLGTAQEGPAVEEIRRILSVDADTLPIDQVVAVPLPIPRRLGLPTMIYRAYIRCDGELCPTFVFEGSAPRFVLWAGQRLIWFQRNERSAFQADYVFLKGKCVDFAIHALNPGFGIVQEPKFGATPLGC